MPKPRARKRQSGTGGLPGIGIAQQWQNRVVIRGGRNLDAAPLSRGTVSWQHPRQQLSLAVNYKRLVFMGVSTALANQFRYLGLEQEKLVEPCQLRKHLQVGEIAIGEIFMRFFRGLLVRALLLPKLLVARIAGDHVSWIRLKQVLQSERP